MIPESVKVSAVSYDHGHLKPIKALSEYRRSKILRQRPTPESFQAFGEPVRARVSGPLGTLHVAVHSHLQMTVKDDSVSVQPRCGGTTRLGKILWGTTRANLANAVRGVSQGYRKDLELHGVGFRAQLEKDAEERDVVRLRLGFAHDCAYVVPPGITVTAPTQTTLVVYGRHKMLVGNVAATLRRFRKPDPYKGKGVRYAGEILRLKQGKRK